MNATAYSSTGVKAAQKTTLPKDIFDVEIKNHELLKTAYNSYLANSRANLAVTKTRGLVSGGGRKPWRQKGTGRARFGSSRNPIWRGGGIAFGPTGKENYTINLPLKARRLALKQALNVAATSSKLSVIEDISLKTTKTKDLDKLLNKIDHKGLVLLTVDKISKELSLAGRNLPNLMISSASSLSVFDVLNADHIVITKPAIKALEERLGVAK